jgi:hypothetical protein
VCCSWWFGSWWRCGWTSFYVTRLSIFSGSDTVLSTVSRGWARACPCSVMRSSSTRLRAWAEGTVTSPSSINCKMIKIFHYSIIYLMDEHLERYIYICMILERYKYICMKLERYTYICMKLERPCKFPALVSYRCIYTILVSHRCIYIPF